MDADWPDGRCVLCCREGRFTDKGSLSEEHLIPESIGGVLTSHFLCAPCNSTLGQYEADLKKDPALRLVIGNLKSQLSALFHSISEGQQFVAQSKRGPAKGTYKKGQFKVSGSRQPDDSLILQTDEAQLALKKMLQKEGFEPREVQEALWRFDEAPENVRVTVAPGFDIVKWTVTGVDPALDARRLVVRFDGGEERLQGAGVAVLKIAYEYLALHLGAAIFGNVFSPIREALARNDASLCPYRAEWKRGPRPAPFHGYKSNVSIEANRGPFPKRLDTSETISCLSGVCRIYSMILRGGIRGRQEAEGELRAAG